MAVCARPIKAAGGKTAPQTRATDHAEGDFHDKPYLFGKQQRVL
jgi:hypothetical protein